MVFLNPVIDSKTIKTYCTYIPILIVIITNLEHLYYSYFRSSGLIPNNFLRSSKADNFFDCEYDEDDLSELPKKERLAV